MGNFKLLDVAIGLVLMMSILSLAASTMVEAYSAIVKKRSSQLREALDRMLWPRGTTVTVDGATKPASVAHTQVIKSLSPTPVVHVPGRDMQKELFPSYVSPTAFVDLVQEVVGTADIPDPTKLADRHGADASRAELEQHYGEAMDRLTGMYKRWSSFWLFVAGLAIAVVGNVSVFHAAQSLWTNDATRDAVVAAASSPSAGGPAGTTTGSDTSDLASVGSTVDQLQRKALPVGWTSEAKAEWGAAFTWGRVGIVLGWLITAFLVTLGAPFWFDLLGHLVALRNSGKPKAGDAAATGPLDEVLGLTSATTAAAPVKKAAKKSTS